MTVEDVENLLKDTEHNGFPVVISHESPFLVGFVLRRDLNLAISNSRSAVDGADGDSLCLFTNQLPSQVSRTVRVSRSRYLQKSKLGHEVEFCIF